jgi:hypothetical protein
MSLSSMGYEVETSIDEVEAKESTEIQKNKPELPLNKVPSIEINNRKQFKRRKTITNDQLEAMMAEFMAKKLNPRAVINSGRESLNSTPALKSDKSGKLSAISSHDITPHSKKSAVGSSAFMNDANSDAFYSYIPNDKTQFAKMFRQDARFLSIMDLIEPEQIHGFMREFYLKYYTKIFYVFQYYQSESLTYPGLSWMLVNSIISDCKFFEYYYTFDDEGRKFQVTGFTEAQSDIIFKDVVESIAEVLRQEHSDYNFDINNQSVNRAGFVSYLARCALYIHLDDPVISPTQALDLFFGQFFENTKSSYKEYQSKKTREI